MITYDAVRAEVDYRADELHKAGRLLRLVTSRRASAGNGNRGAGRRSRPGGDVNVPRQRTGEHEQTAAVGEDRAA